MKSRLAKTLTALALMAAFSAPFSAHAQWATNTVSDAPRVLEKTITDAKAAMHNSVEFAITQALLVAADTMAQRLAAASATWVASGGSGQASLVFKQEVGAWGKNILLDGLSDALNNFSKTALGFNLCEPLDPKLSLRIKLGIARVAVPKPTCSWNAFTKSVSGSWSNIESGKLLSNMTASFEMGQSPLSFALNMQLGTQQQATIKQANKLAERLSTDGFRNLTNPISGDTKTPAAMIKANTEVSLIQGPKDAQDMRAKATLDKSGLIASVGANALRVFSSTLASKLLEKYLKKGMVSGLDVVCQTPAGSAFDLCKGQADENVAAGTNGGGASPAALAEAYFSSLFTPITTAVDDYGPLNDLSACPGKDNRGIWNCAIDQGFVSALSPEAGGYITVREAIAKGFLNGNWELIPQRDSRNGDFDCYSKGYCYSNLVKLRRMRIIPVGWEMAANAKENGPSKLKTLKEVMDLFNASGSPFYRLIDPDWVLKVPVTQCRNQAYGQTLAAANTGQRAQSCVDAPSCISENSDGKCASGFGYCTRERSVWRVDAKSCPSQFVTCQQFSNAAEKKIAVLTNTVDASYCSSGNAGCMPYSLAQAKGAGGAWAWSSGGTDLAYFNSKLRDCEAEQAGCRELVPLADAANANLLPNPSFEYPSADGAVPEGWTTNGTPPGNYERDGASSFDGMAAYDPNQLNSGNISVEPNSLYTLSFYAKSLGASQVSAFILSPDGFKRVPYNPTCTLTAGDGSACATSVGSGGSTETVNVTYAALSAGYERYVLTFSTGVTTRTVAVVLDSAGRALFDAVQLEKGAAATPFHVGGVTVSGRPAYLKAPPAYLGCTGESSDPVGCSGYAKVCRQSEVGCSAYKPLTGGAAITAVVSSGDRCDAACVGYNTFKQERTIWETEASDQSRFPLYFIPSTAKSCDFANVGCDEFTNLEKAAAGGESKAYFTYVRACRIPDAGSDGSFFTWEGSDASGYQLRSYVLRVKGDGTPSIYEVRNSADSYLQKAGAQANPYGPVYATGADAAACTSAIYAAKANPDCRALIDPDGNVFYRLLSKVVVSTPACAAYRKTLSTWTDCVGTGGIWDEKVSACQYMTYVAGSSACSASAVGCRAYTGNQGSNVRTLFTSGFENGNLDSWNGGTSSNESTAAGGKSLSVAPGATASRSLISGGTSALGKGQSYMLTVWIKGQGTANFELRGGSAPKSFAANLALTSEWRRFELGPVIADWEPGSSDSVAISVSGGTGYFDNVQLTGTMSQFALIQGSWKTPAVCDQAPGGQPLAQAQLGCSSYSDQAGKTANFKSFDHLCRAETVGCEAFTDNQQTETPFATYFNARCQIDSGTAGDCRWHDGSVACTVGAGERFCLFNKAASASQMSSTYNDGGTIYSYAADSAPVPADSVIYLINSPEGRCEASAAGCSAVGELAVNGFNKADNSRMAQSVTGKTLYKMIDPADFATNRCFSGAAGCDAWSMGNGQTKYFKDPGEALCEYREDVIVGTSKASGWFKKGAAGNVPCNPSMLTSGNVYGISRNGDPLYGGFAGLCREENSGCTEFTDPTDPGKASAEDCQLVIDPADGTGQWERKAGGAACTVQYKNGRPEYYIYDSDLVEASKKCNNAVSKKQGCVALNQTDNPSLTIDAVATYAASEKEGGKAVAPVSGNNTANVILKVSRDRVCSEWLECNTSQTATDPASGRVVTRCLGVGSCIEKDAQGNCKKWGHLSDGLTLLATSDTDPLGKLGADAYKRRDVSAGSSDFTGFSIPGAQPLDTMIQQLGANILRSPGGGKPYGQSCRVYPEADAPFPASVVDQTGSRAVGYANANICEGGDCECAYRKASYGDSYAKYYDSQAEVGLTGAGSAGAISTAICSGGPYDGKPCSKLLEGDRDEARNWLTCQNGSSSGECTALKQVDSLLGEKGYCLEKDSSLKIEGGETNGVDDACVTWFPIDAPQGRDTSNQYLSAAFIPKIGQERYCSAPAKYCAPHDCANSKEIPAVCTELRYANTGLQYGCFRGAKGSGKSGTCVNIINDYCSALTSQDCVKKTGEDASCQGFTDGANDQAYCKEINAQCVAHRSVGLEFCANMGYGSSADRLPNGKSNCLKGDNYMEDFQCTEDVKTYYGGARASGAVSDAVMDQAFRNNPTYGVDSFCGFDTLHPNQWMNGITGCAEPDRGFCGDGTACPGGTECASMNDLSANDYEFNEKEILEGYCAGDVTYDSSTLKYRCASSLVPYSAKPINGWRTFYGSGSAPLKTNVNPIPLLSANSLKFRFREQEGTWIAFDSATPPINWCTQKNACAMAEPGVTPVINPYPLDLLGFYYYGNQDSAGSASVSYDLVAPSMLLASQIDHVKIKVNSDNHDQICQYGGCFSVDSWKTKELTAGAVEGYGYSVDNNADDDNFPTNYIILSSSNNWSGKLNSSQGSMDIRLEMSQNEPKRLIGATISVFDNSKRGFSYISAFDVRLKGPACGEATYIGSSNPLSTSNYPIAYTNRVMRQSVVPAINASFGYEDTCKPWGAFAISSPQTVVTSRASSAASCEIDKGNVYNGSAELNNLFVRGKRSHFDVKTFSFGVPDSPDLAMPAQFSAPQVTDVQINGSTQPVTGNGGYYKANLTFYASAPPDQMPLRRVRIDWGDGTSWVDSGPGNYFKNHAGSCSGNGFSNDAASCTTEKFSYTHTYVCTAPGGCPPRTPMINVVDNWGMGNGTVPVPTVTVNPE